MFVLNYTAKIYWENDTKKYFEEKILQFSINQQFRNKSDLITK